MFRDDRQGEYAATGAAIILVVLVVSLLPIELPLLTYFVAPKWTEPRLDELDGWVRPQTSALIVGLLVVLGVYEIVNGLQGLCRYVTALEPRDRLASARARLEHRGPPGVEAPR